MVRAFMLMWLAAQDSGTIGGGISTPVLIQKVEPEYTPAAKAMGIEGTVTFEIVVDTEGKARELSVIRPLGFGLDEKAKVALEKWRFKPGIKEGNPVNVIAMVEVNFRLLNTNSGRLWREYRQALRILADPANDRVDKSDAVVTLRRMAEGAEFVPAMYLLSLVYREGTVVDKDNRLGQKWLRAAEKHRYGPALYENVQLQRKAGESGEELLAEAAENGSVPAQVEMGTMMKDREQAARFLLMCALAGETKCQSQLGEILVKKPELNGLRGVAWLQLAAAGGDESVTALLREQLAKLDARQLKNLEWVRSGLERMLRQAQR